MSVPGERVLLAGILAATGLAYWAPTLTAGSTEEWSRDDGTRVILVEDQRASWAYLAVDFPIGTWSPWALNNPAREAFEIQLFDPSGALRTRADALGVEVTVKMYSHNARIYGSGLAEDFANLADLMRSVLANRDFDRAELQRWRTLRNLEWDRSIREPASCATKRASGLFSRQVTRAEPATSRLAGGNRTGAPTRCARCDPALAGRTIAIAGRVTRTEADRALDGLVPDAKPAPDVLLAPDYLPLTTSEDRT